MENKSKRGSSKPRAPKVTYAEYLALQEQLKERVGEIIELNETIRKQKGQIDQLSEENNQLKLNKGNK